MVQEFLILRRILLARASGSCHWFYIFWRQLLLCLGLWGKTITHLGWLVFNQCSSFKWVFIVFTTSTFTIAWAKYSTLKTFTILFKTAWLFTWTSFYVMLLLIGTFNFFWERIYCFPTSTWLLLSTNLRTESAWCAFKCLCNSFLSKTFVL